MRELDGSELAEQMHWLSGGTWPLADGCTGYHPAGGFPAAAWVLNAMYERLDLQDMPENLTHHELHHMEIEAVLREPAMVGDVNLDAHTITTGVGLGFTEEPGRRGDG